MMTRPQDYHRIACSIAHKVLKRNDLSHLFDDLVGLAVVGLIEADATFDPAKSASHFAHLYTVAYRYVLNHLHTLTGVRRSAARRGDVLFCEYDPARHEDAEDGAEDALNRCLDLQTVMTIADTLPQRERVAVEAHMRGEYCEGLTKHGHNHRLRSAVQSLRIALQVAA